jgi:hypothetical protein
MMAIAIFRDPSISGCDRWETNERVKTNLSVENSALRCVSAQPLRLLLVTTGLVQSTLLLTLGTRPSLAALSTTALRTFLAGFAPFGGGIKNAV